MRAPGPAADAGLVAVTQNACLGSIEMGIFTGRRKIAELRMRGPIPSYLPRMTVLFLPIFLGACGLPPALQIASWVANGLSYLTTNKSVSDHGISMVSGQDCAVHRGLSGDDICSDDEEGEAMFASLDNTTVNAGVKTHQRPE